MKKKEIPQARLFLVISLIMIGLYFSNSVASDGFSMIKPNQPGINAQKIYSVAVDNNNTKWFLTELGIVSFNGEKWALQPNSAVQGKEVRDLTFDATTEGTGFWIATSAGLTSLKSMSDNAATSFTTDNATLISNDLRRVAIGANNIKWVGSSLGVAAYKGGKWLKPEYEDTYPSLIFEAFPITSMVTSPGGDTLYVATEGAGVARVYQNDVDGISGASEYAMWGPIIMPSDNVYSIHIDKKGAKWLGTEEGIAKHTGNNTLENWTVYTTAEGLVNNFVQAIISDQNGNVWFGTKGGISVFDGTKFTNYTKANGLNSDNILCLTVDKNGIIWIGTDSGVNSFDKGTFNSFK